MDIFTDFSAVSTNGQWRESAVPGVRVDGEHVWIDPGHIVAAAESAGAPDGWREGFAGMCRFAASKGWLDDDGWIRAHVVIGD
ncbi:hypothetical protein A5719_21740 [Mycolicibacterium peregrinum]|uniref:hypothetical protein n=1 Tax=Mycolicibacterium peregrinum TaxID=43304 RepID=UPI0007EAAF4D|nr:hypothetical protein [Mycolicibacterium peregrinum]OBF37440.1 hypothetical protein A5719_21740 [Mycolicibacterium peregrinum]